MIEKPYIVLLQGISFEVLIRSLKIHGYLREFGLPKNCPGDKLFKPRKSKF